MLSLFTQFFPSLVQKKEKKQMYYLSLLKNPNVVYGFSIHGLWPDYSDGTYPSFCHKVTFNIDKLKPIECDLINYWELPEHHKKLETSFWKHEWLKHGSCMYKEMDELEYFKKALELYEKIFGENMDIEQYKKGRNYMIPFDLNFNLISV